jgi:hypothetical protein
LGTKRLARIRIPAILLEGDASQTPSRLQPIPAALPPSPVVVQPVKQSPVQPPPVPAAPDIPRALAKLPEAYGTESLKLTPRDPHWIHAQWDVAASQWQAAAARAAGARLTLRLFQQSTQGPLVSETPVPVESTRWMVHAPQPAASYVAEIGYYDLDRKWSALAVAKPVRTPPAGPSADRGLEMATLTAEGALQRESAGDLSSPPPMPQAGLVMGLSVTQPSGPNGNGPSSPGGLGFPDVGRAPGVGGISSWASAEAWSSPMAVAPGRPFRLEVNADLIVYGATEPDATLQIGDQILPLDADGTFHLRFNLPDGEHPLTVQATAAGTGERRVIQLCFVRRTEVGR